MTGVDAMGRLETLGADDCIERLSSNGIGRLAVVVDGQPIILPVNYALYGHDVVFRSERGTKLHAAVGQRVAFEIDGVDPLYHEGWSVLLVGTAHEEHDPARLRSYEQLPLTPWVAGPKAHWVRISGGAITGRRITHQIREGESS
jgi:uncharacterized protein